MSADDFQTKFSSVAESMLKAAIAETTKLFETMVDELKAEISKIKTENEDLKRRCTQFENAGSRESAGPSGRCEKHDRGVQCDLVPVRTVLVEQCEPLRHSSLQNQEQQCSYGEMGYILQEHNYGEGTTQMAFVLEVKKEEDSYDSFPQSVLKQEEVEPTVLCRRVLSDEAGSPQASAHGTENEGHPNNRDRSTGELPSPQQNEETQVAQNQSSESEHSVVILHSALKDNVEEESEISQKISETQGKIISEEPPKVLAQQISEVESWETHSSVSPQCQREGETSVNIQADPEEHLAQFTPLNEGNVCEELKRGAAVGEVVPQPEVPVRRKRGRPPKNSKRLQEPVKEIPSPAVSRASLRRCSSKKEKTAASQQLTVEMEEEAIHAPSTEVSCAAETRNTSTVQPRERRTSVTLQDAILLVEAMNQSTVENTDSSPQRMAARPQTQCVPRVDILPTVEEAPAEPETPLLPQATPEAAGDLPVTELTTTAQSTVKMPKQQLTVTTSSTKSSMPSSIDAVKTSVRSLQQHLPHPLIKSVARSKLVEAVSHKLIVMPRSSFISPKIAPLSPSQLPTVLSTVVAAQKKSVLLGSTSADLPLRTPSLSSVPQKTTDTASRKVLPIITSQSTANSTDLQSGASPHSKITIIIPRQVSAVASRKHQSQNIAQPAKQESDKSAAPVAVSSLSQEMCVSVDTQTTSCELFTVLPQKKENMLDNLESPKQTDCVAENPTEMSLASLVSSAAPTFFEQTLSPVVKLTRIPFSVAAKEAVLVPKSPRDGSLETQSVLVDDTTQEKPPSVVISTQPSELLVSSTDICSNLKENLMALSVHISQTLEENETQEKVSLSSENSTILDKSLHSGPLTPPKVSAPAFENPTIAISTPCGTAGEPTLYLDEEVIYIGAQNCALPNDPAVEEKRSAAVIHLTSVTKDRADPPSQMNKKQFLAKLAVSPVTEDQEKASANLSVDTQASPAETNISIKKRLQKSSLMAQLRNHLKSHLQTRRTESNSEPCTETETCTVNPKKPRLENDSSKDKTREPIPLSPKTPEAVKDVTSPGKTTIDATPISPRRFGRCKQGVRPKRTVREPTSVSPRRFSSTKESGSPRNKKSTSLSPRRSRSTKQSASPKNKNTTSVNPKMSCSPKERASPKNTKVTPVSPKTSSSTRESARNKNVSARSKRTSLSRDSASPKKAKSTVSPTKSSKNDTSPKLSTKESTPFCRRMCTITKNDSSTKQLKGGSNSSSPRYSITTHGASPKNTKSVSPRSITLSKYDASPNMPTNESTPFCRRKCTFTNNDPNSKEIKEESNSPSPRYSITTGGASSKNTNRETGSSCVWWPQLADDGDSPRKTGESTPAKQSRFTQHGTGLQRTVAVVDAMKLANAAKDKTTAKLKNATQSKLQNVAKTSQLAETRASCEAVRKCTAKAVLTRSQDNTIVNDPSVPLLSIPVKGPPVVSPLQPLSVIGRLLKNQCGECGRVLSSTAALESHVSLHSGSRPFSCTLCGKSFADAKGLKRHGRVHRNGRIHICQQCGKGFVYSFGLTKHLRMVHRKLKPFICQICNKGFYSKRDVEAHIRIHTGEKPFHCNLCEKKFARRVELNVHYRWHNGEKRHWCPYCGKGFLDFNNMKRHKYIHTGEKPHSCPHCPKSFTQSGHLKKHVKNVHKMT